MKKDSRKIYVLGMFPYPSGEGLHVGHVRIYTAVDVMARYFRMKRKEVLCPTGWDAFGLPAENAAIKAKRNPKELVPKNYANFRRQMQDLDLSFEWKRELATMDPTYYGITQWIFLELYRKGLVYREQVPINWCPKCKTGLANEEVLPDGTHERCGKQTGKKELPQWVMRITDYAEELLADLELDLGIGEPKLDKGRKALDWPRGILEMQRNWIGKDRGLNIEFALSNGEKVKVWTKYWETVFGVSFLVVAPELAQKWMREGWEADREVEKYVKQAVQRTDLARQEGAGEKTGVVTGLRARNPVNGEEVPVYVADYVLASVGTGAVMGVPAHDERDFDFAKKYGLPIVQVVRYADEEIDEKVRQGEMSFEGEGKLMNSGRFNGMDAWGVGKKKMAEWMCEKGWAEWRVNWHLRDWVFSRQRYWGEPIPLVHCAQCGVVPLPENELPLTLPDLSSYEPTETGESPLSRVKEWVETSCPQCGGPARRETDTMPNWAGSCWYHLAFAFWDSERVAGELAAYKKRTKKPYTAFWKEVVKPALAEWLPVDWYLGGAEHAVLHLLYARFWSKVLQDLGYVEFSEPYLRLRSVGMVLAADGRKMSKSWGNIVNPDEMVGKYGSDAVRLYEMFMGPWDQAISWDERSLVGMKRFIERVGATYGQEGKLGKESSVKLALQLARLIKRVERGIVEQKFNTAIAGMMELVNSWRNEDLVLGKREARMLAQVMAPFAPKLAQKMWRGAGGKGKVASSEWPSLEVREVTAPVAIAVQVNGKLRAVVEVAGKEANNESQVMEVVMANEKVKKWLKRKIKRRIFVPGKLVSLVEERG